jgi:cyclophilin family peptidyl-prolyl cis-trans isomerase
MKAVIRIGVAGALLALATVAFAQGSAAPRVSIKTSQGTIVVELYPDKAPQTVQNFLTYVKAHQYDGTLFHRVIPNFMIQGGGLDAHMTEKPTRAPIVNEATNGLKNEEGTISMARETEPNSATAQFFINAHDNAFLDHQDVPAEGLVRTDRMGVETRIMPSDANRVFGYAVFGKVVSGMDVVHAIEHVKTTTIGEYADTPVKQVVIQSITVLP